jgi:hypothetical protein
MRVSERNRAIKKALSKVFGRENVSVRGDRGTAYGWVDITIKVKDPCNGFDIHTSNDMSRINECIRERDKIRDEIRKKVWRILEETGLDKGLYTYYDDMNQRRYRCGINVEFL